MNAPAPDPERFTLAEWALLVGMVTTVVGALYAIWRIVLKPFLIFSARRLGKAAFRNEIDQIEHAAQAVVALGRLQATMITQIEELYEKVEGVPVLIALSKRNEEALGRIEHALLADRREGGRRRNDPH